ncbi:MAG: hypothetical protein H6867_02695 [Rhodospirillales bacterium]|nr:hypothetical protein [Rhodospirillales bacterium]MCB9997097.1 hypothetical protein [Rhodospirillales bacterium]
MIETTTKSSKTRERGMLEQEQTIPDHIPLFADTAEKTMQIDVVVNKDGKVWVIYDRPFPDYLDWVEFDADTGEMTFVTMDGKLQDLGMIIHEPMNQFVAQAKKACLMMIRDGQIRDMGLVPLLVRNDKLIKGKHHG